MSVFPLVFALFTLDALGHDLKASTPGQDPSVVRKTLNHGNQHVAATSELEVQAFGELQEVSLVARKLRRRGAPKAADTSKIEVNALGEGQEFEPTFHLPHVCQQFFEDDCGFHPHDIPDNATGVKGSFMSCCEFIGGNDAKDCDKAASEIFTGHTITSEMCDAMMKDEGMIKPLDFLEKGTAKDAQVGLNTFEDIMVEAQHEGIDTTYCSAGDENVLRQLLEDQKAVRANKRAKLHSLRPSQLRKLAVSAGATEESLDKVDDFEGNTKTALVNLILKSEKSRTVASNSNGAQLASDQRSCTQDGMQDPTGAEECDALCNTIQNSRPHAPVAWPLAPRCAISVNVNPYAIAAYVGYCFWNTNVNAQGWMQCGYGHIQAVCRGNSGGGSSRTRGRGGNTGGASGPPRPPPPQVCVDNEEHATHCRGLSSSGHCCPYWAANGHCKDHFQTWMAENCCLSCKNV